MDNLRMVRLNTPDTHYVVEKKCDNCGDTNYLVIIKGKTVVKEIEDNPLCGYCGCNLESNLFNGIGTI